MINKFSRTILGLEIRSDMVSATLVKSGFKGIFIEKTAHATFTDTLDNGQGLFAALSQINAELDASGALCIAALPFTRLSLRALDVPFTAPKRIRQILPFELEPALPLPVDRQIIDFIQIQKESGQDASSLLISAVEQDELQYYINHLKQAGFDPETITINGHATAMAMAHLNPDENFILVDIGLKKNMVFAVNAGENLFMRSFPVAAEAAKTTPRLVNHMRQTLLAYAEEFPGIPMPQTLYVTGRGADDGKAIDALEAELGLTVTALDFLNTADSSITCPLDISWKAHAMSNPLAMCYCNAMGIKGFNFRTGPFANKKFWMDHKADAVKTGILSSIVFLLLLLGVFINTYMLKHRIDALQDRMNTLFSATFPNKKLTTTPYEQMLAEINAQKNTDFFTEDTNTDVRTIDLLNELSRVIPDQNQAKFAKLVYSAGSVLISGNTDTFNAVDDMKNRLEASDLFKTVTISSANMDRSGKRVEFKLKIELS